MSDLSLTKIRLRHGTWEGRVSGAGSGRQPELKVMFQDQAVQAVTLREGEETGTWNLEIPVPSDAIADGVHTIAIFDGADDSKLGDFTLIAGETADEDLRAEVELLRSELDMLKRAFRRHCLETM